MRTHKIAAIPADGIGPEVISAGLEVLAALAEQDGGFRLDVEHFDWGTERYKTTGQLMPDDGAELLRQSNMTEDSVLGLIRGFLSQPQRLAAMAAAAFAAASPDAAERVGDCCEDLIYA